MIEFSNMQHQTISLKSALEIMRRTDSENEPVPFDCSVRTFNKTTKKGGKLKEYSKVKLLPLSTGLSLKDSLEDLQKIAVESRNPNHFENKTRNIKTSSGQVRKINLNFLITVNGLYVTY